MNRATQQISVDNFAGLRCLTAARLLGSVDNVSKRLILLNIPSLGRKSIHSVYFIKRALC